MTTNTALFTPTSTGWTSWSVNSAQAANLWLNPTTCSTYGTTNPDKNLIISDSTTNMESNSYRRVYCFRDFIPVDRSITYEGPLAGNQSSIEQPEIFKSIPHYAFVFRNTNTAGVPDNTGIDYISFRLRLHYDDV